VVYSDFESLCNALLDTLSTFPHLEDYLPESDWGDIKYFQGDRFYKVFYGASLSNPVDFYAAFEVIHAGFETDYQTVTNRSPLTELQFCLAIQDAIIQGLDQTRATRDTAQPGYLETPPEWFWKECINFLDAFSTGHGFDTQLADRYSYNPDIAPTVPWPD